MKKMPHDHQQHFTTGSRDQRTQAWRKDLLWFVLLASLGGAASYLSVNIPYTEVYIEGRWIFGYMGFVLLRRWWLALLLACVLSLTGFHKLPLSIVFVGNMSYALPIFLVVRSIHARFLDRMRNAAWYGAAWFIVIIACYQAFTIPTNWGILAYLRGNPLGPAILQGWRDQPFFVESLLVGLISALGLMNIRINTALRASRRELATTLYSIGDGVIATDAAGRIWRMNPVAEQLTGWREAEAVGQPLEQVFHILNEETRERMESPVQRVLAEGIISGLSNHTILIAHDGNEYPIADSGAPIRGEHDDVSGVVVVFRDQTTERAAQKELEASHARLKKSLAEKETLLRELYHRTRNTMQVIGSMLMLQASKHPENEPVQKIVAEIAVKIQVMSLVHHKLYQSQDLSRINLGNYIEELTLLVMQAHGINSQRIAVRYDAEDISVLLDTALPCGLILYELLSNALIHAFPDERSGEICIRLRRKSAGRLELTVADDGVGAPPGFEFQRQHSLGLQTLTAIVKHQLRGTVTFQNGNGVTCIVELSDTLYTERI